MDIRAKIKEVLKEQKGSKKNLVGCDFLGNGRISNNLRTFVTYDEFKDFIKKNNISSRTEFFKIRRYVDKKIPTNPNIIYKNKGWTCWGDLYL